MTPLFLVVGRTTRIAGRSSRTKARARHGAGMRLRRVPAGTPRASSSAKPAAGCHPGKPVAGSPAEELVELEPTERGGRPRVDSTATTIEGFADRLRRAEQERSPIEPLTDLRPELTVAEAYAVQDHNVRHKVEAGRTVRGRRLGRTSRLSRHLVGADEPHFGVLLDDMFLDEGEEIPFDDLLQPRVLATMAFVMAE